MDIVLHIGAHRCGSTAVEQAVSQNIDMFGPRGVEIWPPSVLRAIPGFTGIAGAVRARGRKRDILLTTAEALGGKLERAQAAGTQTLVLSEENLIGGMVENLTGRGFYNKALARLEAYAAFLPTPPRRVALAIRDYADYWTSAYLYLLGQRPMPDFSRLAQGLTETPRGWRDLISDIRTVFPQTEILVWQQEHLKGHEVDIACRLTGRTGIAGLTPPETSVNATRLTASDMAAMHRIHADPVHQTGRDRRHALAADRQQRSGTAPHMFTATQTSIMAARYSDDLSALKAGFCDIQFVAPAPAKARA